MNRMGSRKIDVQLLGALHFAGCFPNVPYDLKRVRVLDRFAAPGPSWGGNGAQVRNWLETEPGAFALIGEMPSLHTLLFLPQFCSLSKIQDFSFLKRCRKLKKLDLSYTNFTDCALLAGLPALRWVRLPHRDQLVNREALDGLKAAVEFSDHLWQDVCRELQPAVLKEPQPVSVGRERICRLAKKLRELTGISAYRLFLDKDTEPGLFDSKFGGLPYWTSAQIYPVDQDNRPMQLLAQLDLEALGVGNPLPQRGMLQFFIAQNEMFGCDFADGSTTDGLVRQKAYRVVYHATVDRTVTPDQVRAMGAVENNRDCTPLQRVCSVHAAPCTCYVNDRVCGLEQVFSTAVKNAWGEDTGGQPSFVYLEEDDYCELFESLGDLSDGSLNGGHWMLGYPNFTQEDPRDPDGPYDTLLLQIDSSYDESAREYDILWGDCGVGNFFINRSRLEQLDFSDVLYTWDCC